MAQPRTRPPRPEAQTLYVTPSVPTPAHLTDILFLAASYYNERKATRRQPTFPKVRPHAPNTVLTPPARSLTFWGRVKQRVWAFGVRLAQRDTKYAFKVGMGAGILAAPAFFDRTRPLFLAWYGDWALISVSGICCSEMKERDRC